MRTRVIVGFILAALVLAWVSTHVAAQRTWRPSAGVVRLSWSENGVMTNRSVTPRAPGEAGFTGEAHEMEAAGWSCSASYTRSLERRISITSVRCSKNGTAVLLNEECVGQVSENGAIVETIDQPAPLSIAVRCFAAR